MQKIDPDWWKRLFDETYLITDARSVCDDELTSREVDFLENVLELEKSWPVLDLCGGHGRHAIELSRRGFQDVTVLDYSQVLINLGKERAEEENLNTVFLRNDARDTGLPNQRFKVIMIMASSLGYLPDEAEDIKILREASRLLKPEGSLLLDLPNMEYVLTHFTPLAWHEANDDILVCRQRSLYKSVITCREVVISKKRGLIRDETFSTRLYSQEKISEILTSVGFSTVKTHKDFVSHQKEGDYGCMTNRMIVIGTRK
jgi:D-alanine-D-alanine ligase